MTNFYENHESYAKILNDETARRQASMRARAAADAYGSQRYLEEKVDRLTLACAAMWELIRARTNLTEQDLVEQIAIVDARDGVADGKRTPQRQCGKCGRPLMGCHRKCLYCGFEAPMQSAFDFI